MYYESESGHVREYDDTYEEERISEYHKDGTFTRLLLVEIRLFMSKEITMSLLLVIIL